MGLHGVKTVEVARGVSAVNTAKTAVIGLIGTASENSDPQKPVVIKSTKDVINNFGTGGTIAVAVDSILKQGSAIVVAVNVSTGIKGDEEGKTLFSGAKWENGKIDLKSKDSKNCYPYMTKVEITDGINVLEEGRDFHIDYFAGVLSRNPMSEIAEDSEMTITLYRVDDYAVTGWNSEETVKTAINTLKKAHETTKVSPKLLIAPHFGELEENAKALGDMADQLRAMAIVDVPAGTDRNGAVKAHSSIRTDRTVVCYPYVTVGKDENGEEINLPFSSYFAGVISETDSARGFWNSPSNKEIKGVIGIPEKLTAMINDETSDVNKLNEVGLVTVFNSFGTGFRAWGNRSRGTEVPGNFICVRRTADIIHDAVEIAMKKFIEPAARIIDIALIDDICETVNTFMRTLKGKGAITEGNCTFDPYKNKAEDMAAGKLNFTISFVPASPAERITFESCVWGGVNAPVAEQTFDTPPDFCLTHWFFGDGEGNKANETSGEDHDDIEMKGSYCAEFDGVGSYINTGLAPTTEGSWSCCFKLKTKDKYQVLTGSQNNGEAKNFYFGINHENKVFARMGNMGATAGTFEFDIDSVYKFEIFWTASNFTVKINGLTDTIFNNYAFVGDISTGSNNYVGCMKSNSTNYYYFDGTMWDVKSNNYHYPLQGSCYDVSGNGNHGAPTNISWGRQDQFHWNLEKGFSVGQELVADGDMEDDGTSNFLPADTAVSKSMDNPKNGIQSLRLTCNKGIYGAVRVYENNTYNILEEGKMYICSGWFRGDGNAKPRIICGGPDIWGTSSPEWQYFSFVAEPTAKAIMIYPWTTTIGSYIEIDSLSVKELNIPALNDNSGLDAQGNPLTNPAGYWHNGAETLVEFSGDSFLNGLNPDVFKESFRNLNGEHGFTYDSSNPRRFSYELFKVLNDYLHPAYRNRLFAHYEDEKLVDLLIYDNPKNPVDIQKYYDSIEIADDRNFPPYEGLVSRSFCETLYEKAAPKKVGSYCAEFKGDGKLSLNTNVKAEDSLKISFSMNVLDSQQTSNYPRLVSFGNFAYFFGINDNVAFRRYDGTNMSEITCPKNTLFDGKDHRVAWEWTESSKKASLYIDDILFSEVETPEMGTPSSGDFLLGGTGTDDQYLFGKIWNVIIEKNGVVETQLPLQGSCYDVSGNGNHGTPTNINWAEQDGFHWNLEKGFSEGGGKVFPIENDVWFLGSNGNTSIENANIIFNSDGSNPSLASVNDALEAGKRYRVTVNISEYKSGNIYLLHGYAGFGFNNYTSVFGKGRHELLVDARYSGKLFLYAIPDHNPHLTVDHVSVKEVFIPALSNESGLDVLGNPITNPASYWHNGAETMVEFPENSLMDGSDTAVFEDNFRNLRNKNGFSYDATSPRRFNYGVLKVIKDYLKPDYKNRVFTHYEDEKLIDLLVYDKPKNPVDVQKYYDSIEIKDDKVFPPYDGLVARAFCEIPYEKAAPKKIGSYCAEVDGTGRIEMESSLFAGFSKDFEIEFNVKNVLSDHTNYFFASSCTDNRLIVGCFYQGSDRLFIQMRDENQKLISVTGPVVTLDRFSNIKVSWKASEKKLIVYRDGQLVGESTNLEFSTAITTSFDERFNICGDRGPYSLLGSCYNIKFNVEDKTIFHLPLQGSCYDVSGNGNHGTPTNISWAKQDNFHWNLEKGFSVGPELTTPFNDGDWNTSNARIDNTENSAYFDGAGIGAQYVNTRAKIMKAGSWYKITITIESASAQPHLLYFQNGCQVGVGTHTIIAQAKYNETGRFYIYLESIAKNDSAKITNISVKELNIPALSNDSGLDTQGNPLTNPAGHWHNGAETMVEFPENSLMDGSDTAVFDDNFRNLRGKNSFSYDANNPRKFNYEILKEIKDYLKPDYKNRVFTHFKDEKLIDLLVYDKPKNPVDVHKYYDSIEIADDRNFPPYEGLVSRAFCETPYEKAVPKKIGSYCAEFDGTGKIELGAINEIDQNNFQISIFFKTTGTNGQSLYGSCEGGDGRFRLLIENGKTNIFVSDPSGSICGIGSNRYDDGNWHEAKFEKKSDKIIVYVDGKIESEDIYAGLFDFSKGMIVGNFYNKDLPFAGCIHSFKVDQKTYLPLQGSCYDVSGNGNHGTPTNISWAKQDQFHYNLETGFSESGQLYSDGDMEDEGIDLWKTGGLPVISKCNDSFAGKYSLKMEQTSTSAPWVYNVYQLTIGKTYKVSGWVKVIGGSNVRVTAYQTNHFISMLFPTVSEWTYFEDTFLCKRTGIYFHGYNAVGDAVTLWDKIEVKEVCIPALANNPGRDVLGNPLTNPAGSWHNGAETMVEFPDSLDDDIMNRSKTDIWKDGARDGCYDAASPRKWSYAELGQKFLESNVVDACKDRIFSMLQDGKLSELLIYSEPKSDSEKKEISKFYEKS